MASNEKLNGMLEYIVNAFKENANSDDHLVELLLPLYELAVKTTGKRLMDEYVSKTLKRFDAQEVDTNKKRTPADIFDVYMTPTVDELAAQKTSTIVKTPGKYTPYWAELIDFEIDRTKHKYTPMAKNSWIQELGIKGLASASLSKFMLRIAYEMALGVTKESVKDQSGGEREAYSFPGEVYREAKRRYESGDMPQYIRAQINKCVNDKKQAAKRKAA